MRITNQQYEAWYNMPEVKFEMIKFLKNREYGLYSKINPKATTRTFRAHSVQHLDMIWKATGTFVNKNLYNHYTSVAKFQDGVPMLTLNLFNRDTSDWVNSCWKKVVAYDFFIDIDSPDHDSMEFAKESALELMKMLDNMNCPYELRFSGMGFHFVIPYKFCPQGYHFNPYDDGNIYRYFSHIAHHLNKKISELIDTNIYDLRRLIKCPYSLSCYGHGTYVSVTFNKRDDLLHFKLEDYEVNKWVGRMRGRGKHLFNDYGNGKYFFKRMDEELKCQKKE